MAAESFFIRLAGPDDIKEMHRIRMAVTENRLSDPHAITEGEYLEMITEKGRGWVCMMNGTMTGFAVVDLSFNNIWALFVHPDREKQGMGTALQDAMLGYAAEQGVRTLWLSTDPNTRAERFYRSTGWIETGTEINGEVRFTLTISNNIPTS